MKVRRKSLWRSKNNKGARKFANMRAAKERKRIERANAPDAMPDVSRCYVPKVKPLKAALTGFIVTIKCREDGESVRLSIARGPFGLTTSPTLAGRKVAAVLANYRPSLL